LAAAKTCARGDLVTVSSRVRRRHVSGFAALLGVSLLVCLAVVGPLQGPAGMALSPYDRHLYVTAQRSKRAQRLRAAPGHAARELTARARNRPVLAVVSVRR
jgi:hypothetical protein